MLARWRQGTGEADMADYERLRAMQRDYLAAAEDRVQWTFDAALRCKALALQISILAGHLADQMIPVSPQPPADDEHVAMGCRLFSDPSVFRTAV